MATEPKESGRSADPPKTESAGRADPPKTESAGSADPQKKESARRVGQPKKRGRWLKVLGVLACLLLLAALIAPSIAGPLVRPVVQSAINDRVRGEAKIESLSLSWWGSQRVRGLRIADEAGDEVLSASAALDRSLLSLLFSPMNLGKATLAGSADVVLYEDGGSNLQRVFSKPGAGGAPTPRTPGEGPPRIELPGKIALEFDASGLVVRVRHESEPSRRLLARFETLTFGMASGEPIEFALDLGLHEGDGVSESSAGTVTIDASITGAYANSVLDLGQGDLDSTIELRNIAPGRVERALAQVLGLEAVLGEQVNGKVAARGSLPLPSVSLSIDAGAISASLEAEGDGDRLTMKSPGVVTIRSARIVEWLESRGTPIIDEKLATIQAYPEVTVRIESLTLLSKALLGGDWRGTGGTVRVAATPLEMKSDSVPGGAVAARFGDFVLQSADLASGAQLTCDVSPFVAGKSAGRFDVNLSAGGLLGAAGAASATGPGSLSGGVTLTGFDTQVIEPFVSTLGIDLRKGIGPSLDASVAASMRDGPGGQEMVVSLSAKSEGLSAKGGVTRAGSTVRVVEPVEIVCRDAGALLGELASKIGIGTLRSAPTAVAVESGAVNLDRVSGGDPLGAVAAVVTVKSQSITLVGDKSQGYGDVSVGSMEVRAGLDGPGGSVSVDLRGKIGQPGGAMGGVTLAAQAPLSVLRAGGPRGGGIGPTLPASLPTARALNLTLTLADVPTSVAAALVPGQGERIREQLGQAISGSVRAGALEGQASAGLFDLPAIGANGSVTSGGANAEFGLTLRDRVVSLDQRGVLVDRFRLPASLASEGSPYRVSAGGSHSLHLTRASVRLDETGRPVLGSLEAEASVRTTEVAIRRDFGEPVVSPSSDITVRARGVSSVSVKGGIGLRHKTSNYRAAIDLTLTGFAKEAGGAIEPTLASAGATGMVSVEYLPVEVITTLAGGDAGRADELFRALRPAIGPDVSLRLEAMPLSTGEGTSVLVALQSQQYTGAVRGSLTPTRLDAVSANLSGTIVPSLMLLIPPGENGERPIALNAPARIELSVSSAGVARGADGMTDLARAAPATVKFSIPENIGLRAGGKSLGARALDATLVAPLAAMTEGAGAGQRAPAPMTASVKGTLLDERGTPSGGFALDLSQVFAGGKPDGRLDAAVTLTDIASSVIDALAALPPAGAAAERESIAPSMLIGERVSATLKVGGEMRAGNADSPELKNIAGTATLTSSNIRTSAPIGFSYEPGRVRASAGTVQVRATRELLDDLLLKPAPGGQPTASFEQPVDVTIKIGEVVLPIATGDGTPAAVPSFRLDASAPDARIRLRGEAVTGFSGISLGVASAGTTPKDAAVKITFAAGVVGGGGATERVTLGADITRLFKEDGAFAADAARATGTFSAPRLPVLLFDTLAKQNGLLVDALGESASISLDFKDLSRDSGFVDAKFNSDRASASLSGDVSGGVLALRGQPTATLAEVTPALGARLFAGVPSIQTFEKKREDGPAMVRLTNFRAPIDGDLRKMSGEVLINVGTARFTTGGVLNSVLKQVGQTQAGQVGRRLEPLTFNIVNGVAAYPRYKVPLGEYSVETRGSFDLVSRGYDVIAYVPLGTLADEAAGQFNTGIASRLGGALPLFDKLTMVPIRVNGTTGQPSVGVDLELYMTEFGQQLMRPDVLLNQGLQDILNIFR